jgi:hypothetical protein
MCDDNGSDNEKTAGTLACVQPFTDPETVQARSAQLVNDSGVILLKPCRISNIVEASKERMRHERSQKCTVVERETLSKESPIHYRII